MPITPRERVLTALAHRQPDVAPWQIDLTGDARDNVAAYLHDADFESKVGDHLARCEDDYAVEIRPGFWRDQFGVTWNRTVDRDIGIVQEYLLPTPDLTSYHFPEPNLERNARIYQYLSNQHPDKFRYVWVGWSLFERSWTLRGMENLLVDMMLRPSFVDALMDRILEYSLKVIEHALQFDIDGVGFGDDWSHQTGLIMGARLWRRFIKPRLALMFDRVKTADKYVMLHSCGAVQELFPELIDMGLDVFNTFQPEVMDVDFCKREYGRHLTFYGGISTQQVLPRVGPDQVKDVVREMIEKIGVEGGYIVAPTHDIPGDVPPENILAFIEAVQNQ